MEEGLIGTAQIISILSEVISLIGIIAVLLIFRELIKRGIAMAVAEYLLRHCSTEMRLQLVRWFANGPAVLEELEELNDRMKEQQQLLDERQER